MYKKAFHLVIAIVIGLSLGLGHSALSLANTVFNTLIDNGNGTVTDTATGLIWQQQDDSQLRNFADAVTYCQNLNLAGNSNWRLPNIKELVTIVDYRLNRRAINDAFFPNVMSTYWSATRQAGSRRWWRVIFDAGSAVSAESGMVSSIDTTLFLAVRCVR